VATITVFLDASARFHYLMPPPSNSAADVGAARAEVASARAQSGIGKVDLGECEDQTAYGKLETICGDAYPHLSILGHRLHDPLDIDIFAAGIKPMVEKQAVTCAKVRGLLFQVKRSRGKEKRLSDNRDSGIMQGLAGSTVFGINNMLNKNSSDWTRNATTWGKLVKAGKMLVSSLGLVQDFGELKSKSREYIKELDGIGDYVGLHHIRAFFFNRGVLFPPDCTLFDAMTTGVNFFIKVG
jgi:hypothetical protein